MRASEADDCVALLNVFKYIDPIGELLKKLVVDFVSHGGKRWNKVSARNPKALTTNSFESNITLAFIIFKSFNCSYFDLQNFFCVQIIVFMVVVLLSTKLTTI